MRISRPLYKSFITIICLMMAIPVQAGSLDSPSAPTDPYSAMATTSDIYSQLTTGAAITLRPGSFTEPYATPAASGNTLNEIMDTLPAVNNCGATPAEVSAGKAYWGTNAGGWGPQTGTATSLTPNNQNCAPAAATAQPGNLDSPAAPTDPNSAVYSTSDIYNRLATGAAGAKRTGAFANPTTGPAASGRSLDEIAAVLPVVDDANGASFSEVVCGSGYWSVQSSTWGPQRGGACGSADPTLYCGNAPDSSACVSGCPAGYAWDNGACVDIDECATNNGGCGVDTCTNSMGSFSCTPTCGGILATDPTVCSGQGSCTATDTCECDLAPGRPTDRAVPAYYGPNCENEYICWGTLVSDGACSGNGNCVDIDNDPTNNTGLNGQGECACDPGWGGLICVSPACTCVSGDCINGQCVCRHFFSGPTCNNNEAKCSGLLPNDPNACSGNGRCVEPAQTSPSYGVSYECECDPGREGANCQFFSFCNGLAGNKPAVCSGNGSCLGMNNCVCDPGWGGADCSVYGAEQLASGTARYPGSCLEIILARPAGTPTVPDAYYTLYPNRAAGATVDALCTMSAINPKPASCLEIKTQDKFASDGVYNLYPVDPNIAVPTTCTLSAL